MATLPLYIKLVIPYEKGSDVALLEVGPPARLLESFNDIEHILDHYSETANEVKNYGNPARWIERNHR